MRRAPRPPGSPTRTGARAVDISHEVATAFYKADVDGDKKITWPEFAARMVPSQMLASHSTDKIRELFNNVDTDRSGYITMDEFFMWTLQYVQENTGSGLEAIFKRYDKNGEGTLDASEVQFECQRCGPALLPFLRTSGAS